MGVAWEESTYPESGLTRNERPKTFPPAPSTMQRALSATGVSYQAAADRWGVSKTQAARMIASDGVQLHRLMQLPQSAREHLAEELTHDTSAAVCLQTASLALSGEVGDVARAALEALADDDVSTDEAQRILAEVADVRRVLSSIQARCNAILGGGR